MSIFSKIKAVFHKKHLLPRDVTTQLEETLIEADASFALIKKLITPDLLSFQTAEEVKAEVGKRISKILKPKERKLEITEDANPFVIFVSGVNGSGKTTTIGKLANKFTIEGKKVLIGACDTFRAAAVEQVEHWANITGAEIEKPLKNGEDPSAVAYRSLKRAKMEEFDVLIIDTSGRLHVNSALMAELTKIQGVLKKIDKTKPDLSLLVIDGGAGQNSIIQAQEFAKAITIDGIIVTKLDSSSKGGTLLTIGNDLGFPIYMIGVGEGINDFSDFNADEFIENIFEN